MLMMLSFSSRDNKKNYLLLFGKTDRFVWWEFAQSEKSLEMVEENFTVHHLDVFTIDGYGHHYVPL